jgi:DNA polymerase-1
MLVACDASALEWRMILLLSGDPVGIREINEGLDVHSLNQQALELPSRLIAKIFLFRTIFRGSGWAFANDNDFKHVSTDPDFWDAKNAAFYNKYKGIDACHKRWESLVNNGKKIQGPSGREWKIPIRDDGKPSLNAFVNYPVQGTSADLMAIARVSLRNRLKNTNSNSLLICTVHDSLCADVPPKEVDIVAEMMYNTFDALVPNMKKLWGIESPIPFPCEVKVGHNLADMEKYVRHCN